MKSSSLRQDTLDGLSQEAIFDDLVDALTALGIWLCVARRQAPPQEAPDSPGLGDVLARSAEQHRRMIEAVRLLRRQLTARDALPPDLVRSVHARGRNALPASPAGTRAPPDTASSRTTMASDGV